MPKWISEAGPIQTKKVQSALSQLENHFNSEQYVLTDTRTGQKIPCLSTKFHLDGRVNQPLQDALFDIGNEFGWTVTRKNYTTILARIAAAKAAYILPFRKDGA